MSASRWLPNPLLSAALLLFWLMLNQSIAVGQVLLGALLALLLPRLLRQLRPQPVRIRRPLVIVKLTLVSLQEIIRSAFNVAWLILRAGTVHPKSQFIRIPLDLRDPHGLATLSCIINATPGTVWVELLSTARDGQHTDTPRIGVDTAGEPLDPATAVDVELALHVFDLHDEQWWIDTIKGRYEGPLMEIFES